MASHILQIPIDRFGRVVLPKEIRERLGISPHTKFEVEERQDQIILRPVQRKGRLTYKGGLPVFELGEPLTREQVEEALKSGRGRSSF